MVQRQTDRAMKVIETERLLLRHFSTGDAAFILELVNEPAFLKYIGDKQVTSLEDARQYLMNGPIDSYRRHGFGLYTAELKGEETPIGMCGLLKRDTLPDPDIGFAFLQRYWSRGYAAEAAISVLRYARSELSLKRIVAIVDPCNGSSIGLLKKIGMQFEQTISPAAGDPELLCYATAPGAPADD